ncbi:hypothetical protein OSB04_012633 [Centaurea solstitialis]|uniref:Uncharacterized protein n=1 Tax=Centaurea solstitialis TaxID=347529 RepID=A0AA38WQ51_9ASTR|nr:hypothetical protein OSB04_012633 [Centaurea solstitialis]
MASMSQASIFLVFIATLLVAITSKPQVPCYFIFGDSLMDNGNNNNLHTNAKVNFAPYGIDFPDGPTGRFSNGRNSADVIAQLLGFESFIQPFATARNNEIVKGVNYASGGAGIRDESGQHLGERISLNNQIENHRITILRLIFLVGKGSLVATRKYLHKCIYTVGMGNNDYINNYFDPKYYTTSSLYSPEEYALLLVEQYSQQLQELYTYGARKFGIFAAGNSGCTPGMMAIYGVNSCLDSVNNAIKLFNTLLNTTLNDLNKKYPNAKFIYINTPIQYPSDMNVTNKPCCEVSSSIDGKGNCTPDQVPCSNRQNYIFWDAFHPTEKVSILDGTQAYNILSPLYAPEVISTLVDDEEGDVSDI